MSEADYRKVTYELALGLGRTLKRTSPGLRFCFISGAGTDSTGTGKTMWARIKGQAENDLMALGFKGGTFCFRPGYIQPMDGIVSKTPSYQWMYRLLGWLYPVFQHDVKRVTNTRQLGHAMVEVALKGHPKAILESADLNAVA